MCVCAVDLTACVGTRGNADARVSHAVDLLAAPHVRQQAPDSGVLVEHGGSGHGVGSVGQTGTFVLTGVLEL